MSETSLDVGLWDRFTDGLGAVTDGIVGFLGKIFGSSNERLIRSLGYIRPKGSEGHSVTPGSFLDRVNLARTDHAGIARRRIREIDRRLPPAARRRAQGVHQERGGGYRGRQWPSNRGAAGTDRSFHQPDRDARSGAPRSADAGRLHAVRVRRLPGGRPAAARTCATSTCRSSAAPSCTSGMIAEMVTGEGKTLVATLPAYLNALYRQGRPRHHRQRLPGPPRLRMDVAHLSRPRHHLRLHPERHGSRRSPQGLRLRHHLRHQQRVRLRLPARQHEARPLGR